MKKCILKMVMFLGPILFLISGQVFADHNLGYGQLGRIVSLTTRLQQMVEYSNLRYEVKMTVQEFNDAVIQLNYCGPSEYLLKDHNQNCEDEEYRARNLFRGVQRYLGDAWDYPRIFKIFKMVEIEMYNIQ